MAKKTAKKGAQGQAGAASAFSDLKYVRAIAYGTPEVLIEGLLKAGPHFPTGTVTASVSGSRVRGTGDLSPEGRFVVRMKTSALAVDDKPYKIELSYKGDGTCKAVKDDTAPLKVDKASPVFTALKASPAAVTYGQASVTVTGVLGAAYAPGGDLQIFPKATRQGQNTEYDGQRADLQGGRWRRVYGQTENR